MGCGAGQGQGRTQQERPSSGDSSQVVSITAGGKHVFCSNQHTELLQKQLQAHISPSGTTKASMPPFNILNDIPIEDSIMQYKVPVFGPKILNSIVAIFCSKELAADFFDLAAEMGITIPPYAIDTFLQKKMPRVKTLLDVARARPDCAEGPNADAIAKCECWVDAFCNVSKGEIVDLPAWERFVGQYVPEGWQNRLHFDLVLGNFGFEDSTAKELAQHPWEDGDKATNLEHYSMRWLAKSFSGYGPTGCLTDVANFVFAMQHETPPSQISEAEVVACMQTFLKRLESDQFDGLWIPDLIVVDCELDDMLCWLLVEYMYRRMKRPDPLKVIAQLPTDEALDSVAQQMQRLGAKVVRDPGSRNAEAVKGNFGVPSA